MMAAAAANRNLQVMMNIEKWLSIIMPKSQRLIGY
jgi:hypothetical protein